MLKKIFSVPLLWILLASGLAYWIGSSSPQPMRDVPASVPPSVIIDPSDGKSKKLIYILQKVFVQADWETELRSFVPPQEGDLLKEIVPLSERRILVVWMRWIEIE